MYKPGETLEVSANVQIAPHYTVNRTTAGYSITTDIYEGKLLYESTLTKTEVVVSNKGTQTGQGDKFCGLGTCRKDGYTPCISNQFAEQYARESAEGITPTYSGTQVSAAPTGSTSYGSWKTGEGQFMESSHTTQTKYFNDDDTPRG